MWLLTFQCRQRSLLDHRRWPAKEHGTIIRRREQVLPKNFAVNVAAQAIPFTTGMAQDMRDLQSSTAPLHESIKLLSKKYIVLCLVRIHNSYFRLIITRLHDSRNEGVPRRNARSAKHQRDPPVHALLAVNDEPTVTLIRDLACRPANLYLASDRHAVQDVGHGSAGLLISREVRLDHHLKGAVAVCRAMLLDSVSVLLSYLAGCVIRSW